MSRRNLLLSATLMLAWLPAASPDDRPMSARWQEIHPVPTIHASRLRALAFSPDRQFLATVGGIDEVILHEPAGKREPEILDGHLDVVRSVAWSPDGRTLASAGGVWNERGTVVLWDVTTRKPRKVFHAGRGMVLSLAFAPDGRTIALGCGYNNGGMPVGDLLLCDAATGEVVAAFSEQSGPILSLAFSPDGNSLVTAGYHLDNDQEVYAVTLWDVASRTRRSTLATGRTHFENFQSAAWSPDGRFIAAAGRSADDGRVLIWTAAGAPWAELPKHNGPIWSLAFSPDGATLAVGDGAAGVVRLWDVRTGRERQHLEAFRGAIFGLAFSPDGKVLAAGGSDGQSGMLRCWSRSAPGAAP